MITYSLTAVDTLSPLTITLDSVIPDYTFETIQRWLANSTKGAPSLLDVWFARQEFHQNEPLPCVCSWNQYATYIIDAIATNGLN